MRFLADMDWVAPWSELTASLEPVFRYASFAHRDATIIKHASCVGRVSVNGAEWDFHQNEPRAFLRKRDSTHDSNEI